MTNGIDAVMEDHKITDIRDREIERLRKENDDLRRLLFCEIYMNIVERSGVYALSGDMKDSTIEDIEMVILKKSYESVDKMLNPREESYRQYDETSRKRWDEVKKVFGE